MMYNSQDIKEVLIYLIRISLMWQMTPNTYAEIL